MSGLRDWKKKLWLVRKRRPDRQTAGFGRKGGRADGLDLVLEEWTRAEITRRLAEDLTGRERERLETLVLLADRTRALRSRADTTGRVEKTQRVPPITRLGDILLAAQCSRWTLYRRLKRFRAGGLDKYLYGARARYRIVEQL